MRPPGVQPIHKLELNRSGYLLIEALVYVSVVFVVLAIGYSALYRCIEQSTSLRRNAADIASALQAGERWRADVRAATGPLRLERTGASQVLTLPGMRGEVQYAFVDGAVLRRLGAGPWALQLTNVATSTMQADPRKISTPWRWELELRSRAKVPQIKPLFTFIAAPPAAAPQ